MFCRDSMGPCGQTGRKEGEDGVEGKSERERGLWGQAHSHCQDLGLALEGGPRQGSEQRRQAWSDRFLVGSCCCVENTWQGNRERRRCQRQDSGVDKVVLMLTASAAVVAFSPLPISASFFLESLCNVADCIPVLVTPVSSSLGPEIAASVLRISDFSFSK